MSKTAIIARSWLGSSTQFTDMLYELAKKTARPIAGFLHSWARTANEVSVARLILSPISFYLLYSFERSIWEYCLLTLFWWYTDAVDGVMSRELENKPDTDPGVLIDSTADKVLTSSMYLFHYRNFPVIVVVTIFSEAALMLLGLGSVIISALQGESIGQAIRKMQSTKWGKYKLGFEMASALLMVAYAATFSRWVEIAVYASAITAIVLLVMSLLFKVQKVLN